MKKKVKKFLKFTNFNSIKTEFTSKISITFLAMLIAILLVITISAKNILTENTKDILKTINTAYEDIDITPKTILEFHGYLHKFSRGIGGKFRKDSEVSDDFFYINKNININIETSYTKDISKDIINICNY